jgi:hypothetical protein
MVWRREAETLIVPTKPFVSRYTSDGLHQSAQSKKVFAHPEHTNLPRQRSIILCFQCCHSKFKRSKRAPLVSRGASSLKSDRWPGKLVDAAGVAASHLR